MKSPDVGKMATQFDQNQYTKQANEAGYDVDNQH